MKWITDLFAKNTSHEAMLMDISYIFNLKLFVYTLYLTITFLMPLLDLWLTSLGLPTFQKPPFPCFLRSVKKITLLFILCL